MNQDEKKDILSKYDNIKSCTEREGDLVIKWLTMLILINAGLFAGLTQLYRQSAIPETGVELLSVIISFAAFLACGFIFFAVDASSDQFRYLQQEFDKHKAAFDDLGLPRPFGDENQERRTKLFPRPLYVLMGKPFIIPAAVFALWLAVVCVLSYDLISFIVLIAIVSAYILQADRAYWENRANKKTVALADELLEMAKKFDSDLELKYNKFYIGLSKNGQPRNFVTMSPKKGFIRLALRMKNLPETTKSLESVGFDIIYSARTGRYRIGLKPGEIEKHKEVLSEVIGEALSAASGE